jgi:hypothetical protein
MYIAADRHTDLGSVYVSIKQVQRDFTESERGKIDRLLGTFHATFAVAWQLGDIDLMESMLYQYLITRIDGMTDQVD